MINLNKNEGFTLIEMLVATAVSSIILMMVYTAYSSIIRSVNQGKISAQYYEEINMVLRIMENDLKNLYWNDNAKNINIISSVEGDLTRINFVTVEYKNRRMINSIKENSPSSDIHEVGYYLKPDLKSGKFNLIRRCELHYDSSPLEGGFEEIILKNVESLKMSFKYRGDWTDAWDSREKKRLPSGIKVSIILTGLSNNKEIYEFFTIPNMNYE